MRLFTVIFLIYTVVMPVMAEIGLVTWLHPQADGRFAIESASPNLKTQVQTADGTVVSDAVGLLTAGWQNAGEYFWETPQRAGGGKLLITVTGLPAGTHQVFLRYFSQSRLPGNEWWFALQAGLENGTEVKSWLDQNADRIIAGTGGHDPDTVYETRVGIVGQEDQPVTQLSLWVQRYEWSELARISSIRVETTPSMNYSTTGDTSLINDNIRNALLANGPKVEGKSAYGLAVVSGTLKVRPKSFATLEGQELGTQANIAAARGEYESRQVLIYSPDRELNNVRLECSSLTSDDGQIIPESELLYAPVGYCPYNVPGDLSVHGYWPEPILTFLNNITVTRGDVQSLWYRVHIPRDAKAGNYHGTLKITGDDIPTHVLPVELHVWDFTLPVMPHLRVVVGCNQPGPFEMSYKLNPGTIYGFDDKWLADLPQWAAAGATAINLGYIAGSDMDPITKMPKPGQLKELCRQIEVRLTAAENAGLRQQCFFYMFDEATSDWHPAMRAVSEAIAQRFPDLLLLTTAHDSSYGEESQLANVNGWCPLLQHYEPIAAAKARERGKQIWWYTCNSPRKPFPNLLMTHPLIDFRLLMGFMAYAYQTDGFLYYASFGGNSASIPAITQGPYTKWPIVDDAHDHLYQKGSSGSLPSLRLEAMRDGLEDYDMLWQAWANRKALEERGLVPSHELMALEKRIIQLFTPGNELVQSLTSYCEDMTILENTRLELGQYVELTGQLLGQ